MAVGKGTGEKGEGIKKHKVGAVCKRPTSERKIQTESEEIKKKKFHASENEKKAGLTRLVLDKIDFKTKAIIRDKESPRMILKGSVQQEDITLVNICTQQRSN